jgi:predicted phosphodiesterase
MLIYACSDLHVSPKHLSRKALEFLQEAIDNGADLTLLCGDIYEGTREFKVKESVESANGQELFELIKALPKALIIEGNHDYDLRKHLPPHSNFEVAQSRRLTADGIEYLVTHGWREYDFKMRRVRHIYGLLYWLFPRITKILPFWNTPSDMKAEGRAEPDVDRRYWAAVRRMSTRAIQQAIQEGCVPIWGHTHRRHLDRYENWLSINCGDFDRDQYGDDVGGIIIDDGWVRGWRSDQPPLEIPALTPDE